MTEDYERGRVDATLDDHAVHLAKINGSIERFATEVSRLTMAIQRLADSADADRQTVKVTAEALEKQDQARRDLGERKWTPWQRVLAVVVGVATVVAVLAGIAGHVHFS